MATVKFNLKDNNVTKASVIMLLFNYDNKRLKLSTGYSVPPKYWNNKSQRVREVMEYFGHTEINEGLEDLSRLILKVYSDNLKNGIQLEPEALKKEVLKQRESPKQVLSTTVFWNTFNDFVEYKRTTLPDIKDYDNSLRKHLLAAEKIFGAPLNFALMKNRSNGFIEKFDHYLTYKAVNSKGEKGLTVNTIGKQYKNLKVFLNWCFEREITPTFSLKHLVTKSEEVDSIYLTETELKKIFDLKIDDPIKKVVRDLFIIGCETGLRFSDFSRLESHHIKDDRIEIFQKKVSKKVIVPICTDPLIALLKKYKNKPPHFESITEFNRMIRDICETAKITEQVTMLRTNATVKKEVVSRKFELVSSHTCRSSFCTNHFLNGMPVTLIMAISGHKTERAFMRYLKIDNSKKVDMFRENMERRKAGK